MDKIAGLIDRVKPRISQWEATTGRRITPTMLDSLIRGQLEAEAGKAQQSRALDIQQQGIDNQKEQQKKADKAAKVKGITDLASTAGMGYLTYKAVTKPSAMSELLAYQKSLGATPLPATAVPSAAAPAYTGASVTSGVSGIEYGSGAAAGAQTALGGGASAVGAQTALAGGETASLAAYDAALAEGAAAGVGSTAGTTAAGFSLSSLALPAAAVYGGSELYKALFKEDLGQDIKRTGQKVVHEIADVGRSAVNAVKDIGSAIGDIFGW